MALVPGSGTHSDIVAASSTVSDASSHEEEHSTTTSPASIEGAYGKTSFLSLPVEIRVTVYKLCLSPMVRITLVKRYKEAKKPSLCIQNRDMMMNVAMLASCKQVYNEAADMLYGRIFVFDRFDNLGRFLQQLLPKTAARLRQIYYMSSVPYDMWSEHWVWELLCRAKDLERLHIYCVDGMVSPWPDEDGREFALTIFNELKPWFQFMLEQAHSPESILAILSVSDRCFQSERETILGMGHFWEIRRTAFTLRLKVLISGGNNDDDWLDSEQ